MLNKSAWVEIDLDNLKYNVRQIRQLVGAKPAIMAVVKANGYGHGIVEAASSAIEAGASWLGVACVEEGLQLRKAGIREPILVFREVSSADEIEAAIMSKMSLTVFTREGVNAAVDAARRLSLKPNVHLKVDTGMGRIGVRGLDQAISLGKQIQDSGDLSLEGVYTHFACAESDLEFTKKQLASFLEITEQMRTLGIKFGCCHAANSAGLLQLSESHLDMVRTGIMVYGLYPSPQLKSRIKLKPVMSIKATLALVKTISEGEGVSYGRTFIADSPRVIGTVPVGYGDGYPRALSNKGYVIIRGKRAPLVGTVCMDYFMVDLTGIPDVSIGDEVCLIGGQDGAYVSADDLAELVGTINYEIVSRIGPRLPRVYKNGANGIAV